MENEIKATIVLEMLGRPKEHIEKTIKELVETMEKEEINILKKTFSEGKKIEEKNLFTVFTELEISFKELVNLLQFVFKYLPSHVEIIEPENLKIANSDFNYLVNEISIMMHRYDEVTKGLLFERNTLLDILKKNNIKSPFPEKDLGTVTKDQG